MNRQEKPVKSETAEYAALIERIAAKDRHAFELLYDRLAPRLYGFALRMLKNAGTAEDVVQEVFLTLWQKAGDFQRHRGEVMAWLMTLCRNRCIDRMRGEARRPVLQSLSNQPEIQGSFAGRDGSPLEHALHGEEQRRIIAALQKLPAEQRELIEKAYFDGMTQSEIARQMGIALGTVKTRIRLGMQKLRMFLRS